MIAGSFEVFEDLAVELRVTFPGLRADDLAIYDTLTVDEFSAAMFQLKADIFVACQCLFQIPMQDPLVYL